MQKPGKGALPAALFSIALLLGLSGWAIFAAKKYSTPSTHFSKTVIPPVSHQNLITENLQTGSDVTRACLTCHENAAKEVMHTSHWTWESESIKDSAHKTAYRLGKKNQLNNFCIGITGNWSKCTSCHAGYGWKDKSFDFSDPLRVDCLVCHDRSGTYQKGEAGLPKKGVDLTAAAKSVGKPGRENCGSCHFRGGGGNAVKHGDLDESLYYPSEDLDVHMGKIGLTCIDCHRTQSHQITGRAQSVSKKNTMRVSCTDCHSPKPHKDQRINIHSSTVACQTCHIPSVAKKTPTKTNWDWSQAGQDRPDDPHSYMKKKGAFIYTENLAPEYLWYNGTSKNYVKKDSIAQNGPTSIVMPNGSIDDSTSKIWPFKIHRAKQPFDAIYRYLLQPVTAGKNGYWENFNWDTALTEGSKHWDVKYSGKYGFAETQMAWGLSHMVSPKEKALRCDDCHSSTSRLPWKQLGYPGDPIQTRLGREQLAKGNP